MPEPIPAIFLSSTFYDLRQVRADLAAFVEESLGYRLLASEHASFPVDPNIDTIENCRRRVENEADVFVLIIGNRYGSVVPGESRSVTNIEYLTARAKALPIFAFVYRDLLAVLQVWERNPNADYLHIVDTPTLFEFIQQVRAGDRVWTFPFETAQEIICTLRTQLAYEFARGLRLTAKARPYATEVAELSGEAFRVAVERPAAWPARLIASVVEGEIASAFAEKQDYNDQIVRSTGEHVSEEEIERWLNACLSHGHHLAETFSKTLNHTLNVAQTSGDIRALVYGARSIGAMYRDALAWSSRVRAAHVPEHWRAASRELSKFLGPAITELESFGPRLRKAIDELIQSGQPRAKLHISLDIDRGALDRYLAELKKIRRDE